MDNTADVVVFDEEDFKILESINKALFGNGSILTPDQRRDLANKMHIILGRGYKMKM